MITRIGNTPIQKKHKASCHCGAVVLELTLPVGSRFSLYPLGPVTGRSRGLRWPIDGLLLEPWGMIGTSNEVSGPVRLEVDQPRLLVILPRRAAAAAVSGLCGVRGG